MNQNAKPSPLMTEAELRERAERLVEALRDGDPDALADLFQLYHERLYRLVSFRLDPKLHSRIDPSDLLQDAYLDASQRLDHFLTREDSSIAVWLRLIVLQRIQLAVRHHLLTSKRDARRETPLCVDDGSNLIGILVNLLEDSITSPSACMARNELVALVEGLLAEMPDLDREVLTLRHFEQIPNDEVAEVLGISVKAASNRYVRALCRLQKLVAAVEQGRPESVTGNSLRR